jgi:hypothetical protein
VPGFSEVWRAYQRSYDRIGCDPAIGERLVEMLHQAGCRPSRCELVFFGACSGSPGSKPFVENISINPRRSANHYGKRGLDYRLPTSIVSCPSCAGGAAAPTPHLVRPGLAEGRRTS